MARSSTETRTPQALQLPFPARLRLSQLPLGARFQQHSRTSGVQGGKRSCQGRWVWGRSRGARGCLRHSLLVGDAATRGSPRPLPVIRKAQGFAGSWSLCCTLLFVRSFPLEGGRAAALAPPPRVSLDCTLPLHTPGGGRQCRASLCVSPVSRLCHASPASPGLTARGPSTFLPWDVSARMTSARCRTDMRPRVGETRPPCRRGASRVPGPCGKTIPQMWECPGPWPPHFPEPGSVPSQGRRRWALPSSRRPGRGCQDTMSPAHPSRHGAPGRVRQGRQAWLEGATPGPGSWTWLLGKWWGWG